MDENARNGGGWLNSLRRTGDSLLGMAQSRFELFAVELQEEKLRTLNLLAWVGLGLALGGAGLLVGLGALSLYLWNIAGYPGLIGLSVAALAAAAGVFLGIRHRIRNSPIPFPETIGEFRKDRECMRSDN